MSQPDAYGALADLMTAAEVAKTLKVGRQTVTKWFERGLPRYRIGLRDWVSEAELAGFVYGQLRRTPDGLPPQRVASARVVSERARRQPDEGVETE